ncbi:MAG: glucosaminidase domain-containing protein [Ginsengibacter sp.]
MLNRIGFIFLLFFITASSYAQKLTCEEYISKYKDLAISEMKRMGIPAAITIAQGILESENGNSDLALQSNNHFGIKCKSSWIGDSVTHDDDEKGECFRAYKTVEESYRDHSNFLRSSARYANLFQLDPADYKGWAYGLKKAGYATNPRYPEILIRNIEKYNLEQYSLINNGEVPANDIAKEKPDPLRISPAQLEKQISNEEVSFVANSPRTINGSKALFVSKGTSLLAIASQNNIKLSKLLEMNDLTNDGLLDKDGIIFLEKKKKEGNVNRVVVQNGQTLHIISQNYGVILKNLCEYNQLKEDAILSPGYQLFLKPQEEVSQKIDSGSQQIQQTATENKTADNYKSHEVQQGEGLYAISKKYGVSVANLKEWNNLKSDNLHVGEVLIISK